MLIASEEKLLRSDAEANRIFLPDGALLTPRSSGSTPRVVQQALASTLRSITRLGADGFYRGEIGERIADHVQQLDGSITAEDLASYQAQVVEPLVAQYRDVELVWLPPPAGGITTVEALGILSHVGATVGGASGHPDQSYSGLAAPT